LTADGRWVQFSHSLPHLFRRFMHSLGLAEMFDDPEWAGLPMIEDNAKREAFWRLLQRTARQRTLAQWREVFEAEPDVWGELFRRGPEALEHPQMLHDGRVVVIDDPMYGPVRQPGRVVTLHEPGLPPLRPAPRLGEVVIEDDPADAATTSASIRIDGTAAPIGRLPLEGVTVIELGVLFAAPFGATLLTDLGARVIKIEPIEGDPIRTMMPFPEVAGVKVLQGKESIAVDLTSEEGLAIVHELVRGADIVLQSFRAGAAERTRVDAATLKAINPNLVYLNAPGYGTGGPCGGRAAFAPVIAAAAGMSWRHLGTSVPEGPHLTEDEVARASIRMSGSTGPSSVAVDSLAALSCASAMLLGLLGQRRGNGAPVLETSMLGSMAQAMSEDGLVADGLPEFPTVDEGLFGIAATYRLYECRTGWVFLAVPLESEWRALLEALGNPSELSVARFDDAAVRNTNDAALTAALDAIFRTDDATAWEKRLGGAGVGCVVAEARVTEEILMADPLWRDLGMVVDVVHPTFDEHPRLAPVVKFSRSATVARPGCVTGQHTDAVLTELGFDADRIADLRARGVIGG
ncbi:MAG: CoA transferase, partial [Acidimicrobiia bacterium]